MAPTAKQQAANQMRTLKTIRDRLLLLSASWGDMDCFFEKELERMADGIESVRRGMDEFRKGDHDGQ